MGRNASIIYQGLTVGNNMTVYEQILVLVHTQNFTSDLVAMYWEISSSRSLKLPSSSPGSNW